MSSWLEPSVYEATLAHLLLEPEARAEGVCLDCFAHGVKARVLCALPRVVEEAALSPVSVAVLLWPSPHYYHRS
jgi:hypothetical protein